MNLTKKNLDDLTYQIIGAAVEVQRELGAGFAEEIYEKCLIFELQEKGLKVESQGEVPVVYKGQQLEGELRYDLLVEDAIIIEIEAVEEIEAVYKAKLLSNMKFLKKPKGILLNFNCVNIVNEGKLTMVNEFYRNLPAE